MDGAKSRRSAKKIPSSYRTAPRKPKPGLNGPSVQCSAKAGLHPKELVGCRRDNVTADAAARIGIFPLDLAEMHRDDADSG
jgi:hypothetical protein